MNIGQAYTALKAGSRVARTGWNGKGLFLILVPSSSFVVNRLPLSAAFPEGTVINYQEHVDLVNDTTVSTWSPSGSDALAEDWLVL